MVVQRTRDHLADEAAVMARAMETTELLGWRDRLTVDLIEPAYAAAEDAAVATVASVTCAEMVDREIARRERAARLNSGLPSPADRQYQAILDLAAAVKPRVSLPDFLAQIGWSLRRVGRDGHGRDTYSGPSPMCKEGNDRFVSWGQPGSRYLCRRCGAKGDVVQLAMQANGIGFAAAVRELAVMAGVTP